jgi:hypothetical protein
VNEAHALAGRLIELAANATPSQRSAQATGDALVPFVNRAVAATPARRGSLSDRSMSHWHAKGSEPFKLTGKAVASKDGRRVVVRPAAETVTWSKGLGPMRALTDGRAAYAAGDRRQSGTYTSKKTGLTTAKTRKVKRATGATRGKGTWTNAEAAMVKATPGVVTATVADEMTTRIRKAVLGG